MTLTIYNHATFLSNTLKSDAQEYCSGKKNSCTLDTDESLIPDKFDKMFFNYRYASKQSHGNKDQPNSSPLVNFGKDYCRQFPSTFSNVDWSTDVLEYLIDEKIQRSVGGKSSFSLIDFRPVDKSYSNFSKNFEKFSFCCNHSQQRANSERQSNTSDDSHSFGQTLETKAPSKKVESSSDNGSGEKSVHATYTKSEKSQFILALQAKLNKRSRICRNFAKIATKISALSNLTIGKLSPNINATKNTLGDLKVLNHPDVSALQHCSSNLEVKDFVAHSNQVETSVFYPQQLTSFEHPYLVTTESNMRSVIRVETKNERNNVIIQHENDQRKREGNQNGSTSESSVAQTLTPTSSSSSSSSKPPYATSEIYKVRISCTRRYLSNLKHAIANIFISKREASTEGFVETQESSAKDDIIEVEEKNIKFDGNKYSNIDHWFSSNETLESSMKQSQDGIPFVHPSVLRCLAYLGFNDHGNQKVLSNKTDRNKLLEKQRLKAFPLLKNCVNALEKSTSKYKDQENCNEIKVTMWSMFFWKLLLHFPQSSYISCKDCGDTIASNWDCIEFRKQLNDYTNQVCDICFLTESQQKWVKMKEKSVSFLSKCLY